MNTKESAIRMGRRMRTAGAFFIMLCLLCAVTSCSKVTKENYDRLEIGMEYSQVVDILGEPSECSAVLSIRDCTWGGGKTSINVKLVGDEVIFMSSKGM